MLWWLVVVSVSAVLWSAGNGSSLTSGLPSLEELIRNGSLLERYSTHDGEERAVPGVRPICSEPANRRISKITFIALPGAGVERPLLRIMKNQGSSQENIQISGETQGFGEYGYEMTVPMSNNIVFNDGDMLLIQHPLYDSSGLRLLHQVGDEARNICWSIGSGSAVCEPQYDYPLLAIDTDSPGCIEGLVSASELRRQWENRALPVLYSSPERLLPLNCPSASISRILVGAYSLMNGGGLPHIVINNNQTCNFEVPVADADYEGANVYECVLDYSVVVDGNDSLAIRQRNAGSQIGFLHDSQMTDTPLISVDSSGDCSSLSETELMEMAALYILNITEIENNLIDFVDLTTTQDCIIVNWTFVARDIGEGQEYPQLYKTISSGIGFTPEFIENTNCTETPYPNVYECSVTPEPFKDGDILGFMLPARSSARLLLSFLLTDGGLVGAILNGNDDRLEAIPLVTLGVVPGSTTPSISTQQPIPTTTTLQSTPPVITTNSATHPPETTPPTIQTNPESNTGVIVGAVVGLVLAVLLFLAVVLLLIFILCRKKNTKYEVKDEEEEKREEQRAAMDNPVYSGRDSESGRPEGRGSNHQYEVTASQQPSKSTTNSAQVYEEPDKTSTNDGRKKMNESFDNPGYYSTIHEVHSTTDNSQSDAMELSSNHYEMAIYVPTQEQRNFVESGAVPSENIYATLEESQVGSEGRGALSFFEECETYWRPASNKEDLYQQLSQRKYREIPKPHIRITEHLGSGQFGTVNKGVWQRGGEGGEVEVAVKMLQEGTSEQDTVRFLQEAAINGQFRHANIVQLLGVVTVGKPVMIVLELVTNGDLRGYLLKHKPTPGELPPPDTPGLLSQFCVQVARGMEYLSGKAFVHRDLAARNILITDSKNCKISDFGMARDLEEGTYYVSHGGKVPVKWTAPEALHYKKYSTASDVWSFGCLMYEIWSLGHKPFEGYTNQDTLKLIDNGCRLAPPPGCPLEMYSLMITCWNAEKSARPQFREIVETLSQPESLLLRIPEEVSEGHPQASVLGAPLEAGRNLYTELQNTYMH